MNRDREQSDKLRRADERLRERRMREEVNNNSNSNNNNKEKDFSKPNTHRVRTWIDRSGSFKVEAEFLGVQQGKIHLHKINGVKIAVACNKLSTEDLEYVEKITGTSLDKYKSKSNPSSSTTATTATTTTNVTTATPTTAASEIKESFVYLMVFNTSV